MLGLDPLTLATEITAQGLGDLEIAGNAGTKIHDGKPPRDERLS
jgi:hypothetical protein